MSKPLAWNDHTPWRCPSCNRPTDMQQESRWKVVTCCQCGCEFTCNPSFNFGRAGIVCKNVEHGHEVRL